MHGLTLVKTDPMEHSHQQMQAHGNHYQKLILMVVLSFASMYILMYAMVDRMENVFPNVNQFYMAGLMTCPMVVIEIALMSMMYNNRRLNIAIVAVAVVALTSFYFAIRQQTGVGDRQFLRSMIPHHSSAILMCESANIKDPEIKKLCSEIVSGQQKEIDLMKAKLHELKN